MFMVLAWIYSVAMIVKSVVYEKELRLKEVMKMMGLGNSVHWTAWFITAFSLMFATIILLVIILKVSAASSTCACHVLQSRYMYAPDVRVFMCSLHRRCCVTGRVVFVGLNVGNVRVVNIRMNNCMLQVGRVLEHSDPSVIIVFLCFFTISTIVFCFMISVFFTRANLAAVCGGIFYYMSYLPYTFCARWEEYMTVHEKALSVSYMYKRAKQ